MSQELEQKSNVRDVLIQDVVRPAFMKYATTVIKNRAIPDARDGLKPVHRRVIFGAFEEGATAGKPYKKSARVVGRVIGTTHPHGDTAVYDSLVRMTQDFSLRYPLIEGQGNFGAIDGSSPAAMRYTESRMSKLAMTMTEDLNKNTVDFKPNYDDSETEPTVFPSALPNMLVNGSSGIAVGLATNMAPHNLREIGSAIKAYIESRGAIEAEELIKFVSGL